MIDLAKAETGLGISLTNAKSLINFAMDALALEYDTANVRTVEVIENAMPGVEYPIVADMGVVKVKISGSEYKPAYTVSDNNIKFDQQGSYTVTVLHSPTPVTMESDIPEIDPLYHLALLSYLKANVGVPSDQGLMTQYAELASSANQRLSLQKRRGNILPARLWR